MKLERALLRSDVLRLACFASVGTVWPRQAIAQGGVPEGMKTSESYTNLQQISPETTGTLGAGTMSSRSRPETGVILLEEVSETGSTVSAELVLDGGVAATTTFQTEPGFSLNRGMFYDVEVRSKSNDGAFLQVVSLRGKPAGELPDSFFTKAVFSTGGRFGAYGPPTDIKVCSRLVARGLPAPLWPLLPPFAPAPLPPRPPRKRGARREEASAGSCRRCFPHRRSREGA